MKASWSGAAWRQRHGGGKIMALIGKQRISAHQAYGHRALASSTVASRHLASGISVKREKAAIMAKEIKPGNGISGGNSGRRNNGVSAAAMAAASQLMAA
jgi:hypothetical protein